jgi:hypothetical protein
MAQYKQPRVHVGMVVHWYDGGRRMVTPVAAIVTAVAEQMVDLSVVVPLSLGFLPKQGVRHVDDPDTRLIDQADVGAWDYTPETKAVIELGRQIRELGGDKVKKAS